MQHIFSRFFHKVPGRGSRIIKGTLILTAAGLITRIIGFAYRIYLSNALGAERIGIYQLIFPVYGICHTFYASGIQTAISKLVAEAGVDAKALRGRFSTRKILLAGALLSFFLALTVSVLLYLNADFVAVTFLKEAACAPSLRILSLVFPFCGITSCINGYYYGRSKSTLPAFTQVAEQLVRVGTVALAPLLSDNIVVSCELAVLGVLTGELASHLLSILSVLLSDHRQKALQAKERYRSDSVRSVRKCLVPLIGLAAPLTLNRLLLSLLHSFEAIMIPTLLRKSGLSQSDALSRYGILNGMALPFLYFASAITNALAVLLLPAISEQDAMSDRRRIASMTERSVSVTLLLGIFACFLFLFFGDSLGTAVFHNASAGIYLNILSCLCPFLYLSTTLSAVLNGLGKTMTTFFTSLFGSVLRIALLSVLIPKNGMQGCFVALLLSQIVLCASELILVYHHTEFRLGIYRVIVFPAVAAAMLGFLIHRTYLLFTGNGAEESLLLLLAACLVYTLSYVLIPIRLLFGRRDGSRLLSSHFH